MKVTAVILSALLHGAVAFVPVRHTTSRVKGLIKAATTIPPPTQTASSTGGAPKVWTPQSWRNFEPRQMPVYDDKVCLDD